MLAQLQKNGSSLLLVTQSFYPSTVSPMITPVSAMPYQTLPGPVAPVPNASSNIQVLGGEAKKYAVIPKMGGKVAIDTVQQTIATHIKPGSVQMTLRRNRPEFDGALLWKIMTKEDEAEKLKRALGSDVSLQRESHCRRWLNPYKANLIPNESKADFDVDMSDVSALKPSAKDIVLERDAPRDLGVASWPPGVPRAPRYYAYDDEATFKETAIYLIDRGLDASSEVSNRRCRSL